MTGLLYPGAIVEVQRDNPTPESPVTGERSCRNCRRRQLHISADIMRCSEKRSSAVDTVIWFKFSQTAKDDAQQAAYEQHARLVASRCKFFQSEGS